MKNTAYILFALCAFFLVSCAGTYIKLPQVEPAAFNMHRGAFVAVESYGHSAYGVDVYLTEMIKQGGYYKYALKGRDIPDYTIELHENASSPLVCEVVAGSRGRTVWSSETIGFTWGDLAADEPTDKIMARRIYQTFVPHKGTYWAKVKVDEDTNPSLAKAVDAIKEGDFGEGMRLTELAVAEHPNDPEALYLKALLIRNYSRYAESDYYLHRALRLEPNDSRFMRSLKKNDEMRRYEIHTVRQLRGL